MTEVEALQAGQTNCSGSPLRAVPQSGQTKPVTLFISKILRACGQRVFLSCFYFFPDRVLFRSQTNCSGSPLRAVPQSGQTKPVTLFISKILRACGQRVFLSCFYFF